MKKRLFLLLTMVMVLFITCSRILDSGADKMKLSGLVLNIINNQPIEGAYVSVTGDEEKDTFTDVDGKFEFSLEPSSETTLSITVEKDSFETITKTQVVKPGKDVTAETIYFTPEALTTTIKGVLLNGFSKEAISGADIASNILDYDVYTNSTGNFTMSFDINEPTDVELIFKQTFFESDTIEVTVEPGTTNDLKNLYLNYTYGTASVSGKVVDARADTALAGVKVSLVGSTNVYTTSDANGLFELAIQVNETESVSLMFSKYPFYSNTVTLDQISPEEEMKVGDVQLTAPSYSPITVYGKVLNSSDEPVDGIDISVTQIPSVSASTDENGRFNFNLQINKETELEFIFDHDQYISLEKDTTTFPETDLNFGIVTVMHKYESAQIKGIVVNKRTGAPINDAKVVENSSEKYTSTDKEGKFNLPIPVTAPTNVTLTISKYPFDSKTVTLEQITPEDILDIGTISLDPPDYEPITISGQVIDTDTKLVIPEVSIFIEEMPELATETDEYGNFSVEAQVDSTTNLTIHITKSDVYNSVVLNRTVEPETNLLLGKIEMDSKYDPISITGRVMNYTTSGPLEGVNVSIVEYSDYYTKTDAAGEYLLNPTIVEESTIHLAFYKADFISDTAEVSVSPNTNATVSDVPMLEKITKPASIVFLSASPQDIRVKESGGTENSILTFEVRDSSGIAIDVSEDTTVYVQIVAGPNGGESIYPNELRTNSKGILTTSLTSGTIAGAIQVQAYMFTEDGDRISSNPATLVIHAGHPDATHFSIAAEQLNIPGLVYQGVEDIITAYVADQYGNWVADGTPVYFTADGGGIQGFGATTNAEATVILQSGHKDPEVANLGFVNVTAKTTDVNNQTIQTTGLVLFSGHPEITNFSPSNGVVFGQGGSATVDFNVWDVEYHNPLSAGTKLNVTVSPDTIASVYSTFPKDGLADVQFGHTSFSFTVVDNPSNASGGNVMVKLELTSPNGNVTAVRTATITIP